MPTLLRRHSRNNPRPSTPSHYRCFVNPTQFFWALFTIIVFMCESDVGAQTMSKSVTASEEETLFALINKIDNLDTSTFQYVHVIVSPPQGDAFDKRLNRPRRGFLVAQDADRFTVRQLDLLTTTHDRTSVNGQEKRTYKPVSMLNDAAVLAAEVIAIGRDFHVLTADIILSRKLEALLLARACAQRGLMGAYRKLLDSVQMVTGPRLFSVVRDEFAIGLYFQIIVEIANPDVTRAMLIDKCKRYLELFGPDSKYGADLLGFPKRLTDDVALLAQQFQSQLVEDIALSTHPITADSGSIEAEVKALIFALRNETTPPISSRYPFGEFLRMSTGDRAAIHPASRLVAIGRPAVPLLLDALSDHRPSRCVRYIGWFYGELSPYRVSRIADDIITQISGHEFPQGSAQERELLMRQWWDSVK